VDAARNLFIADALNFRIRKVGNTQGPTLVRNSVTAIASSPASTMSVWSLKKHSEPAILRGDVQGTAPRLRSFLEGSP
jgi:hypothetical protein